MTRPRSASLSEGGGTRRPLTPRSAALQPAEGNLRVAEASTGMPPNVPGMTALLCLWGLLLVGT